VTSDSRASAIHGSGRGAFSSSTKQPAKKVSVFEKLFKESEVLKQKKEARETKYFTQIMQPSANSRERSRHNKVEAP
jgi:hypothetical protein